MKSEPIVNVPMEVLVEGVLAGRREAQNQLARRLLPFLQSRVDHSLSRLPKDQREEPFAQMAEWLAGDLVKICRTWDSEKGTLLAWCQVHFTSYITRWWRGQGADKRKYETLKDDLSEVMCESPSALKRLEERDPILLLDRWANTLSMEDRLIVFERMVGEESSAALAPQLGLSAAAIDKRVERLTRKLAAWLGEDQNRAVVLTILTLIALSIFTRL